MSKPYTEITRCRGCHSTGLEEVIHLGEMAMSGIFPKPGVEVPSGPLTVVRCVGECGLVQLKQTYNLTEMYGDNYGYRSGLNPAMVMHLASTAQAVSKVAGLKAGSTVVDIGSNDGTLLAQYLVKGMRKIGIDPTAKKFRQYYDDDVEILADFFTEENIKERFHGPVRADLVTSISCFYDLEDPIAFMADIEILLKPQGIWYFEQSYLPLMLAANAYDTICHEHLEYYSLTTICWMAKQCGLRIVDAQTNKVNGGSIAITAVRDVNPMEAGPTVKALLNYEKALMLDTKAPYEEFKQRVHKNSCDLVSLVLDLKQAANKTIMGYGASTKGNTLLQTCNFTNREIDAIVEINPDKYGCVTPGSNIPIVPEGTGNPDYYLVLPWHFRDGIIRMTKRFRQNGGKLIFPLPEVEIVGDEQ